jgi:hypothetical protein
MIKLYRRDADGSLAYHEAWVDGAAITEHWGRVGSRGETREHKKSWWRGAGGAIEKVLAEARRAGFAELPDEARATLFVEYVVEGMGTAEDRARQARVEARLNELLGWTGLGRCEGGSMGSGTMEVFCDVVDFALAKRTIEADLAGSGDADYARIDVEDADDEEEDAEDDD